MAEETEVSSTGDLKSAANETFDKVSTYLRAELSGKYYSLDTLDGYVLIKSHKSNYLNLSTGSNVRRL